MTQRVAYHPPEFDLGQPPFVEYTVAGTGQERFDLPTLQGGERPHYVVVATGSDVGYPVAFGDSAIDASTDPQVLVAEGQNPLFINVHGMTHFSVDGSAAGAIMVAPLGDS